MAQESFAEKLRRCRLEKGLSQKEVGLLMGGAVSVTGNWESGAALPSKKALEKLVWLFPPLRDTPEWQRVAAASDNVFGEALRKARLKRRWLLRTLADRVGCACGSVGDWERGTSPSIEMLEALRHYLPELREVNPPVARHINGSGLKGGITVAKRASAKVAAKVVEDDLLAKTLSSVLLSRSRVDFKMLLRLASERGYTIGRLLELL
jgi:transcriptional regulator with XRE-family HTH domain